MGHQALGVTTPLCPPPMAPTVLSQSLYRPNPKPWRRSRSGPVWNPSRGGNLPTAGEGKASQSRNQSSSMYDVFPFVFFLSLSSCFCVPNSVIVCLKFLLFPASKGFIFFFFVCFSHSWVSSPRIFLSFSFFIFFLFIFIFVFCLFFSFSFSFLYISFILFLSFLFLSFSCMLSYETMLYLGYVSPKTNIFLLCCHLLSNMCM